MVFDSRSDGSHQSSASKQNSTEVKSELCQSLNSLNHTRASWEISTRENIPIFYTKARGPETDQIQRGWRIKGVPNYCESDTICKIVHKVTILFHMQARRYNYIPLNGIGKSVSPPFPPLYAESQKSIKIQPWKSMYQHSQFILQPIFALPLQHHN